MWTHPQDWGVETVVLRRDWRRCYRHDTFLYCFRSWCLNQLKGHEVGLGGDAGAQHAWISGFKPQHHRKQESRLVLVIRQHSGGSVRNPRTAFISSSSWAIWDPILTPTDIRHRQMHAHTALGKPPLPFFSFLKKYSALHWACWNMHFHIALWGIWSHLVEIEFFRSIIKLLLIINKQKKTSYIITGNKYK